MFHLLALAEVGLALQLRALQGASRRWNPGRLGTVFGLRRHAFSVAAR